MRSTCTMTTPPELRAAVAIASASSTSASRSIVMLPSGSAVVPRRIADVDRQGPVEEVLLAAQRQRLDEVLGGAVR